MDSSRTCYSICINTKVATHAHNFSAKAIELEDCVENWLSDAWFETYTVNCNPDDSEVTYEITAEEDTPPTLRTPELAVIEPEYSPVVPVRAPVSASDTAVAAPPTSSVLPEVIAPVVSTDAE